MSLVSFRTLTEPTTEPIALSDAKLYLRVDFTDDDALITRLISSARKFAESQTSRSFATQTIQAIHTIEPAISGTLYGPISEEPNWYHYQQELGANPFGVSQFYFDLPAPPAQSITTIEYQLTVFDSPTWTTYTETSVLDSLAEPARVYFPTPPTAYRWRFTYQAGYDGVTYLLPWDLKQVLFEIINFWYMNREGDPLPQGIMSKLMARRQVNT